MRGASKSMMTWHSANPPISAGIQTARLDGALNITTTCAPMLIQRAVPSRKGVDAILGKKKYQEDFIRKLSPELAKQCRDAFSNGASKPLSTVNKPSRLLIEGGLQEYPVIMMLLEVTANAGQKIGTLIDFASDTNYITHKTASKLDLRSEEITLVVHGVEGYEGPRRDEEIPVKIRVEAPTVTLQSHQLVCYGLDNIADVNKGVTARQLQKFFPDIPADELARPKEIC